MMGLLTLSGGRCQCFPLLPSSATAITISQRCGEELITHSPSKVDCLLPARAICPTRNGASRVHGYCTAVPRTA